MELLGKESGDLTTNLTNLTNEGWRINFPQIDQSSSVRPGTSAKSFLDAHYADPNSPKRLPRKASTDRRMPVLEQRQVVGVKEVSEHSLEPESWF